MQAPVKKKTSGLISASPALRRSASGEGLVSSPLQGSQAPAPFSPGTPTDAPTDPTMDNAPPPGFEQITSQQRVQVQGQFQPEGIIQGNAQPRGVSQRGTERGVGQNQDQPKVSVFDRLQVSSSDAAQVNALVQLAKPQTLLPILFLSLNQC